MPSKADKAYAIADFCFSVLQVILKDAELSEADKDAIMGEHKRMCEAIGIRFKNDALPMAAKKIKNDR